LKTPSALNLNSKIHRGKRSEKGKELREGEGGPTPDKALRILGREE
jgi:hypothetical protein